MEDLDGDFPSQQGVLAQINVGHPAAGQVRREVITLGKGVREVHGEPALILGEGRSTNPYPAGPPTKVIGSAIR